MDGNIRAISIFTGYMLTNISLTTLIIYDIYRTFNSQLARRRSSNPRKSTILVHSILAMICLGVTWYYMIAFFSLSYRSWAYTKHIRLPHDIVDVVRDPSAIKLGLWLKDVQLFRDAWEVVVETPGRLQWSQPIFFITAGWSFFIAMNAHSRDIRYAWAYMVLGQLVAISFAMNLFFIAVLAHQVAGPGSSNRADHKDVTSVKVSRFHETKRLWTPPGAIYSFITITTVASVLAVPVATGTPYFLHILAISHVFLLLPPILCSSAPAFMRVKQSKASYDNAHLLQLMGIFVSFGVIQSYTLWQATHGSTPDTHLHRHSNVYIQPALAASGWLPSRFVHLLDHPAVSSVGWDSILCITSGIGWLLHAR